ncbi:unnamed protein product [Hymenolepis diminuta]|uniref:Uncharacterized protein n=1 Tax=Hymenolepis diminuta TaxID=6216 RepID=A0A564Z1Y0_HYMDI|nr:unnamed protein product [Hymenolepis diminuta]
MIGTTWEGVVYRYSRATPATYTIASSLSLSLSPSLASSSLTFTNCSTSPELALSTQTNANPVSIYSFYITPSLTPCLPNSLRPYLTPSLPPLPPLQLPIHPYTHGHSTLQSPPAL